MAFSLDNLQNYVTSQRFYVYLEGDNEPSACFSECSGLSYKAKVKRFFEGGVNNRERILVGQPKFKQVKLKRGVTDNMVFWDWISQVWNPDPSTPGIRRNISIVVFNPAGDGVQCWTVIGAFPISWKAPAMKAKAKNLAMEEIKLAFEGLEVSTTIATGATLLSGRDEVAEFG
ncbi:MAG: phage tail protein [Cyanobacteria bacterium P01_F01_bin.56]